LITWVSLRVDAPPKARPVDLLSTDAPAPEIAPLDAPEIASALLDVHGRPHAYHRHGGEAEHCHGDGCYAHHEHGGAQHAHNHTSRPLASPAADVAPVSEPAEALPTEPQAIPMAPPLDLELVPSAPLEAITESLPMESQDVQILADTAASALAEAMAQLKAAQELVARAAEEPVLVVDIRSVSEGERRLQEMEVEEEPIQAPTPREAEEEEPIQAPTPREEEEPIQAPTPREAEEDSLIQLPTLDELLPEIETPAITRRRQRRLRGAWWSWPDRSH